MAGLLTPYRTRAQGEELCGVPQPQRGRFTVETANHSRARSYRMYDLSGRMVAQERLNSPSGQFVTDVSLPPGMYILQVELESGAVEGYKIQVVK